MHELIVFCEAVPAFLLNSTQINVFFLRGKESFAFINHVDVIINVASSRCLLRVIDAKVTAVGAEMDTVLPVHMHRTLSYTPHPCLYICIYED